MDRPEPVPSADQSGPRLSAEQLLTNEITDLVKMIARLKEMSLEEDDVVRLVKVTIGVGTTDTRLAGLLKARLAFEERPDISTVIRQAIIDKFGSLALFEQLGESGLEEDDPLRLAVKPSGRQAEAGEVQAGLDGDPTATTYPEPTGERPSRAQSAGRKTGPGKKGRGRIKKASPDADQPDLEF